MPNKTRKKDARTYKDRARYLADSVGKRRTRLKKMAVEIAGGKCQICGYKKCLKALDFHHLNPKQRSFSLDVRGLTKSWNTIVDEIHKCVLVCANCHREIHAGVSKLPKAG